LAVGDFDNDGCADAIVAVNGGAPVLLRNECPERHGWVGLQLVGTRANRDAVGAKVRYSVAGVVRERVKTGGGGFLSSHDPRLILGLGAAKRVDWVEVHWPEPSRRVDRIPSPPVGGYIRVVEGRGPVGDSGSIRSAPPPR
jgi:hypothetical protein